MPTAVLRSATPNIFIDRRIDRRIPDRAAEIKQLRQIHDAIRGAKDDRGDDRRTNQKKQTKKETCMTNVHLLEGEGGEGIARCSAKE